MLQSVTEDIVHSTGKDIVEFLLDIIRDFFKIFFISFRNDNGFYLCTYSTEGLFLQTSYGQIFARAE